MPEHDLVVIGGGPGGYVAAIRAAELGLRAACIEKEPVLGGTCLRVGCIPSKAMLESSEKFYEAKHGYAEHGILLGEVKLQLDAMLARKNKIVDTLTGGIDGLFRKHKVTRYLGTGKLTGPGRVVVEAPATGNGNGPTEITAKHIIIATGSKPATLPGIELDGDRVGTSTEALSYDKVPKHLVVIGGGYIGLELGSVWNRLGSKVTVLEYLDRIFPGTDSELAREALEIFKKQGIEFRLGSKVTAARAAKDHCIVECAGQEPIKCDRVLVAVGRMPYTTGLGLESVGVTVDNKGRIPVADHYRTTAEGVYAIGDVIAGPMLAHKAEYEGTACVEQIVTGYGRVNYDAIPAVIFTEPEIAAVGKTEDQLKEEQIPYRKGTFAFKFNGRAMTLANTLGKAKVLAHAETDRVLGVHIMGPHAGDIIAEATAAMTFGATSEDIARVVHAHPTLPETLKEAAIAASRRAK